VNIWTLAEKARLVMVLYGGKGIEMKMLGFLFQSSSSDSGKFISLSRTLLALTTSRCFYKKPVKSQLGKKLPTVKHYVKGRWRFF